jgi:hypothetical protein
MVCGLPRRTLPGSRSTLPKVPEGGKGNGVCVSTQLRYSTTRRMWTLLEIKKKLKCKCTNY